jgi:chemotaxis protein histidine kinase CheA
MLPSLICGFIAKASTLILQAYRSLEENRVADLRRAAHTLKSNSATFGAMAFSVPAREFLYTARDNAMYEIDSIVRCIEMGATDYLPKPFDASLPRARLIASLANRRLRDIEREYLEQIDCVIEASAVEVGAFEIDSLNCVAGREDALGKLARVF